MNKLFIVNTKMQEGHDQFFYSVETAAHDHILGFIKTWIDPVLHNSFCDCNIYKLTGSRQMGTKVATVENTIMNEYEVKGALSEGWRFSFPVDPKMSERAKEMAEVWLSCDEILDMY